jgi:hypothetical protein
MNKLIAGIIIFFLIVTIIVLAVKGVLYALTTTHWVFIVVGLLMLTNKYTRKVLAVAILFTAVLYIATKQ